MDEVIVTELKMAVKAARDSSNVSLMETILLTVGELGRYRIITKCMFLCYTTPHRRFAFWAPNFQVFINDPTLELCQVFLWNSPSYYPFYEQSNYSL